MNIDPSMGEETDPIEYDRLPSDGEGAASAARDEARVFEWEIGLPSSEDLTPLSQPLVPPELASAFSITPEDARTILDVHRASQNTLSSLRRQSSAPLKSFSPFPSSAAADDPLVLEADDPKDGTGESSPKTRRLDAPENSNDDQSARALKRARLVWTPQLHKRFVDVVAHLGIKNAVPKTIMQLMNVEGLTRENVASHLQKYRLYLKRMQGLSNEGPSSSDHLFASTPVPQSLHEVPPPPPPAVPMPYAVPTMIPMPVFGMAHHHHGQNGPMRMVPISNHHGYDQSHHHHHYGAFGEQRSKDWPGGNKFGSIVTYPPHVMPNDQ